MCWGWVCVGVIVYVLGLSYVLGYRDVCVDLGCQVQVCVRFVCVCVLVIRIVCVLDCQVCVLDCQVCVY